LPAASGHLDLTAIGNKTPPIVSGRHLTVDTATYDIIGRDWYVGFKAKF
jgi:iron complex outermembrane recepter protein